MEGKNEVYLEGFLKYPNFSHTANGYPKFNGKIAVPRTVTKRDGEVIEITDYIKISAWRDLAEELGSLPEDTAIRVVGLYNERSYDGNCKHCGSTEKKYWTDVNVSNYEVLDG